MIGWKTIVMPSGSASTDSISARDSSSVFAGLRALGFPERNRAGISGTLVRLREAAEADQAVAR